MKKLADSLKIYAQKQGLTDAEVARRAQLSEVRYGHYVRGRSEPDLMTLLRICNVLGVTPNDLLMGNEEPRAISKSSKKDETQFLRNRITSGTRILKNRHLMIVSKVIDELIRDAKK